MNNLEILYRSMLIKAEEPEVTADNIRARLIVKLNKAVKFLANEQFPNLANCIVYDLADIINLILFYFVSLDFDLDKLWTIMISKCMTELKY